MLQLKMTRQDLAQGADAEHPKQRDHNPDCQCGVTLFSRSYGSGADSEPISEFGLSESSASAGVANQLSDSEQIVADRFGELGQGAALHVNTNIVSLISY